MTGARTVPQPQVDVTDGQPGGLAARVEREGGFVGPECLVEATGVLVEPAEKEVGQVCRPAVAAPGQSLLQGRARLGRLAQPPRDVAEPKVRLRERGLDRRCRSQRACGPLQVVAGLADAEAGASAPVAR